MLFRSAASAIAVGTLLLLLAFFVFFSSTVLGVVSPPRVAGDHEPADPDVCREVVVGLEAIYG